MKSQENELEIQQQISKLMKELFPICRSITGNGVRESFKILKKIVDLDIKEIPSGTKVYDWEIPKEWNIKDAYIIDPNGKKIVDFNESNLYVLNYSIPIKKKIKLDELKSHLYTLPEHPNWIPYRTSYYKEEWGFCIPHNMYESLVDGEYEVCIDSNLEKGHLTYGEYFLKGESDEEVLISTYICHPSMCNDNLSGVVLSVFLAKKLSQISRKFSYRFLFIPETIGSIAWLSINEKNISKIKHGLVATCVGDNGSYNYKKSRQGNSEIDRIAINVLKNSQKDFNVEEFFPSGSDERQYCSPGFNLPVGVLTRTRYARFPEYHTSADNLDNFSAKALYDSYKTYLSIIEVIEKNRNYINLNKKCEPNLGKRGLYNLIGGQKYDSQKVQQTMFLWILNFSDGNHSLLDISEKSGFSFEKIMQAADLLVEQKLLKPILG